MKKTFVEVMLELPVDATLRSFLTEHGLPVADDFAWEDSPENSQTLVEAIKAWPDTAARDQMIANLMASVELGDEAGKQAMFEVVVADVTSMAGFMACEGNLQRSFWLYVNPTRPCLSGLTSSTTGVITGHRRSSTTWG